MLITLSKEAVPKNYQTISLISHPCKAELKITLNRLQPQPEETTTEKHENFLARKTPNEQIFNLRILGKKHLQQQQYLNHDLVDFMKALDRVWREALCPTIRKLQP